MAKLESGSLKLQKELQPLEEVVGAALNHLEKQLAERPVRGVAARLISPWCPWTGPWQNRSSLIYWKTPLRYTPAGSPISISATAAGDHLEVEVADCGPGFSPEDLDKIFEMYYRGSTGQDLTGYGLGLSICRAIVEAHGGRIWAVNRDGGGAAVQFTLPLAAPEK